MRSAYIIWIVATALIANAETPSDDAREDNTESAVDVSATGRLPVWYNGRVTDLSRFASDTASRLSGKANDANDAKRILQWMFEALIGSERSRKRPLIRVQHAHLLRTLGSRKTDCSPCFLTLEHLGTVRNLEGVVNQLKNVNRPWTDEDRQAVELYDRVELLQRLIKVLSLPNVDSREGAVQALQRDSYLQSTPIPLLVPPPQAGSRWTTLATAMVVRTHGDKIGAEPNPAAELWLQILTAFAKEDQKKFDQAIREYLDYVARLKLDASPWSMKVPDGWTEPGVSPLQRAAYQTDGRGGGMLVTALKREEKDQRFFVTVRLFPHTEVKPTNIVNYRRLAVGLAPIPDEQIRVTPFEVAGRKGWTTELESPNTSPFPSHRSKVVVFTDQIEPMDGSKGVATWVIVCDGSSELIDQEQRQFDEWLESLKVGPRSEVLNWFDLLRDIESEPAVQPGMTFVAAFIPVGQSIWVLRGRTPPGRFPDGQNEIVRMLRSLRPAASPPAPFEWDEPPLCTPLWQGDQWSSVRFDLGNDRLDLMVDVVASRDDIVPEVIRQWRGELGMTAWESDALQRHSRRFNSKLGKTTLISWRIPRPDDPTPESEMRRWRLTDEKGTGIRFSKLPPEDWAAVQSRSFQAAYRIDDGDAQAVVVLLAVPGNGGGVEGAIQRWRNGITAEDEQVDEVKSETSKATLGSIDVDRIELTRDYKRSLIYSVPESGRTWYLVLSGDAAAVEESRKDFEAFAGSLEVVGDQ